MNAIYRPGLGVNPGRDPLARFIVVLDSRGSVMNIRYRVDLDEAERAQLVLARAYLDTKNAS